MISVRGSVTRSFFFPADRETAFNYYSDFTRIVDWLPLISLVKHFSPNEFRVRYQSKELGVYDIAIDCDVRTLPDRDAWVLRVNNLADRTTTRPVSGFNWSRATGFYESESVFTEVGHRTRIDYTLNLHARLYKPGALKYVPGTVLDQIAHNITHHRMEQIAGDFIVRSIAAYKQNGRA